MAKIVPESVRKGTEPDCKAALERLLRKTGLPRALLAFAGGDDRFEFDNALMTDETHKVERTHVSEGLMGHCLAMGQIVVYPRDQGTERYYLRVDTRTVTEAAVPVFYNSAPGAVLLVDIFQDDADKPTFDGEARGSLERASSEITQLLEAHRESHVSLRDRMRDIVIECVSTTSSVRGYLAVKAPDGKVEIIAREEDGAVFKLLSQKEGLCGKVFQTGRCLNAHNVWLEAGYVASDVNIMSEIVLPMKHNEETIAVLNMESDKLGFYNKSRHEERLTQVKSTARTLMPLLEDYFIPSSGRNGSSGLTIGGFMEQAANFSEELEEESSEAIQTRMVDFVLSKLVVAFEAERSVPWIDKKHERPKEMAGLNWDMRVAAGVLEVELKPGKVRYLLYSPYRVDGNLRAILGIILNERPALRDLDIIEQFCRIGGVIAEGAIEKTRSIALERLVCDMLAVRDTRCFHFFSQRIAEIANCDHATLFGSVTVGEEKLLVPIASTSETLFTDHQGQLHYKFGEGYTGHVALKGERMLRYPTEGVSSPEADAGAPHWEKKISEERGVDIGPFVAFPIKDSESGQVIGVLRAHRAKRSGKGGFEPNALRRIEMICFVLGELFRGRGLVAARW